MNPNERVVAFLRLANHQHTVYRHARGEVRKKMLSSLFSQGAREMLDFAEFSASYAGVPLNSGLEMSARKGQWNGAHEVEVQAWPGCVSHLHFDAVGIDAKQLAVADQPLANFRVDVREHVWTRIGLSALV
jgi:hypothetical protein